MVFLAERYFVTFNATPLFMIAVLAHLVKQRSVEKSGEIVGR